MTFSEAVIIAAKLHAGQTDNAGLPYILHPLSVARRLALKGFGEEILTVAVLWDVGTGCNADAKRRVVVVMVLDLAVMVFDPHGRRRRDDDPAVFNLDLQVRVNHEREFL